VNVVPKVGGRVASVRATTGDKVAAGALLFTLETADYETQLRQANAVLQSANATMTRTSDAGQGQQLIQAQAQVDAAQVNYDNAKGLYDKTKRLYDQGVVAKQQLDDVESRFKAAGFQLDSARQSLGLVRDKAGSQASDVVAGQVNQARAQVDFARSQLEATRVRSPLAGKISYRNVEVGELVGPTTLAFIVMDDRTVLAEAGVSERVVGNLRPGMEVKVLVDALGSSGGGMETASLVPVAGTIDSVSPSADPRTMLYLLRVRIDNKEGRLKPGMLAKLHIPVSSSASALLIPEKAAFSAKGGDSVYVVADGRVSLRPVSLGESDGDSVEVLSGLKPGELVVTEAQEFLSEGQRVVTAGG
jgi:RND family efflux transporter MFP subunit